MVSFFYIELFCKTMLITLWEKNSWFLFFFSFICYCLSLIPEYCFIPFSEDKFLLDIIVTVVIHHCLAFFWPSAIFPVALPTSVVRPFTWPKGTYPFLVSSSSCISQLLLSVSCSRFLVHTLSRGLIWFFFGRITLSSAISVLLSRVNGLCCSTSPLAHFWWLNPLYVVSAP